MDKKIEDRKLEDSKTFENLKEAFFEEAGLASRYRFFATVAEFEGKDRHGALFRELAEGGAPCAHGCLDFLRLARDPSADVPIGNTSKNLEAVLQTESTQYLERYPEMARIAREEGFTDVASWFDTLAKLKRSHAERIRMADEGASDASR
jgi:rubrerythrin